MMTNLPGFLLNEFENGLDLEIEELKSISSDTGEVDPDRYLKTVVVSLREYLYKRPQFDEVRLSVDSIINSSVVTDVDVVRNIRDELERYIYIDGVVAVVKDAIDQYERLVSLQQIKEL